MDNWFTIEQIDRDTFSIGITLAGISILIISPYMKRKRTGYQSGFRYRCKL